jgi:hypothetical protein
MTISSLDLYSTVTVRVIMIKVKHDNSKSGCKNFEMPSVILSIPNLDAKILKCHQ